ncbi:MAG: RNase adapter RapZ [Blastocatellia bacterium]|nr:RNase adapter RapZ [Blastocatellia bacterium]
MNHLLIITGLSGSGKHSVFKVLEDMGYFCVDNLPVKLLPTFVDLCQRSGETLEHAAVVVDVREPSFTETFPEIFRALKNQYSHLQLVFVEASDAVLTRRFSETRRPHPMSSRSGKKRNLQEAIGSERALLDPIRELASVVVDTSAQTVHTLRQLLVDVLHPEGERPKMQVTVMSFGFKHGLPTESDLIFDVRFLVNPYFVPELREQTGKQKPVVDFLKQNEEVLETQKRFEDLLGFVVPRYAREGRSYLTLCVGCTGGKHRSVMMAEVLGKYIKKLGFPVRVKHRDIEK